MKLTTVLSIAAVLTIASFASAQSPPPSRSAALVQEAQGNRVAVLFDWFNSGAGISSINAMTWDLTAQIALSDNLLLDADIPWAFYALSGNDVFPGAEANGFSSAAFGVPQIGAHFAAQLTPHTGVFAGLGLGVPVLGSNYGTWGALWAGGTGSSLRGIQGVYRFLPGFFPLVLRGGVEAHFEPFYFRADLAPNFLVSFRSGQGSVVTLDQGNDFGLQASFGLRGGVRFQEAFILTSVQFSPSFDGADHVQTALEPFVGYESPGKVGVIARYGLLMPLDPQLGFAFDKGQILTNRFMIGAKL